MFLEEESDCPSRISLPNSKSGPGPPPPMQDQQVFLEEESGDVVMVYKQTDIVRIAPSGDITLNTGGWYTVGCCVFLSFPSSEFVSSF